MTSPVLSRTRIASRAVLPAISKLVPPGSTTFSTGGSAPAVKPTLTVAASAPGGPGDGAAIGVHAMLTSDRFSGSGQIAVQTSTSREDFAGLSDANAFAIGGGRTAAAAAVRARSTSAIFGAQ